MQSYDIDAIYKDNNDYKVKNGQIITRYAGKSRDELWNNIVNDNKSYYEVKKTEEENDEKIDEDDV